MSDARTSGPLRSVVGAALLVELGLEFDVPASLLLEDSGLTEDMLHDFAQEIAPRQELVVASNLIRHCAQPCLGLMAGSRYGVSTVGSWAFAMVSRPTVREAAAVGKRLQRLSLSFCTITFEESDSAARAYLDASEVPTELRRFFTERTAAAMMTALREYVPGGALLRAAWAYPEPPGSELYREIFQAPMVFDSNRTFLEVPAELLSHRLPQANKPLSRWYEQQAQQLLASKTVPTGPIDQLLQLMDATPADLPTLEQAAAHLHLSTRTLRRKLAENGTSYRQLTDGFRARKAVDLLRTGLSVQEVAAQLGYAESASLQHAFKRWKGTSPGRYGRHDDTP